MTHQKAYYILSCFELEDGEEVSEASIAEQMDGESTHRRLLASFVPLKSSNRGSLSTQLRFSRGILVLALYMLFSREV